MESYRYSINSHQKGYACEKKPGKKHEEKYKEELTNCLMFLCARNSNKLNPFNFANHVSAYGN